MHWFVRVLGLGIVAAIAAPLGGGCTAEVQVGVAPAPTPAGRPTCASVCQQMAGCPAKGPACPQTCQSTQSVSSLAGCDASLQAELDCLASQPGDICTATHAACQTQTLALSACMANYCTHERMGSPNQVLCLQAAAGL